MAIEALMPTKDKSFRHQAGHDLECLLNTILTVCHYTIGPSGQLHEAVEGDQDIKFNSWFTMGNQLELASTKSITLEAFNTFVQPILPQYWQDFTLFLRRLIQGTWKDKPYLEHPNVATHQAYHDILKEALAKYILEERNLPVVYAFVPKAKHPIEDDQLLRHSKRLHGNEAELVMLP